MMYHPGVGPPGGVPPLRGEAGKLGGLIDF